MKYQKYQSIFILVIIIILPVTNAQVSDVTMKTNSLYINNSKDCKENMLSLDVSCNFVSETFPINDFFSCMIAVRNHNSYPIAINKNIDILIHKSLALEKDGNYEYSTYKDKLWTISKLEEYNGYYIIQPNEIIEQEVDFGRLIRLGNFKYVFEISCQEEYAVDRFYGSFEVVPKSVYGQLKTQADELNELKKSNQDLIEVTRLSVFVALVGVIVAAIGVLKEKIIVQPKISIKLDKEIKKLLKNK